MNITNTSAICYYTASAGILPESSAKKTDTTDSFRNRVQESVVDEFKRKHPDRARHVDQQLRAGRSVRERNGNISTENMSMAEYQAYFYALLDTIPYDHTQQNNTTTITISDKGWEQMRKDPDYEAWILGYFVEDRSVHNPFFAWGNDAGSIIFERFGASIEEHRGDSFNKAAFQSSKPEDDDEEEEDWWIKRHKRMKKLMKEQVERTIKKDLAQKSAAREEYARQQHVNSMRQHSFLTTGSLNKALTPSADNPSASMAATAIYGSILDF